MLVEIMLVGTMQVETTIDRELLVASLACHSSRRLNRHVGTAFFMRYNTHLAFLLIVVLVAVAQSVLGAEYRPQIGKPYNDFVLPRIDAREPIALSQFRGKKVLLIHFASW